MIYYDLFASEASPSDASEDTTEHSIDDIYAMLDSIDGRLSELQIESSTSNASSSAQSVDLASVTDATASIAENTTNIYVWVVVLAFIIVIYESKKIFRGSIKKWLDK